QRSRSGLLVARHRRDQAAGTLRRDEARSPGRGIQRAEPLELHGAERQQQFGRLWDDYVDLRPAAVSARDQAVVVKERPRTWPAARPRKRSDTKSSLEPIPVVVERQLVVLPRGYRRGVIDGYAVVYNPRTQVIVD